jgi:hypothetical protein
MYLSAAALPFSGELSALCGESVPRGRHAMTVDQDGLEPFDPSANLADTAAEFEDDDRDDDAVEQGTPELSLPVGGGLDG